ncbi:MAG: bifunctional riboflavin kinase/FAD synthetase [Caldicoprobacterales bacterium]|jgi:riboflavin kinase/FMN adenylyltransferase|nr:bifunctional riboflavin kinase/FAD synthetase [Clostridiales bacterium]
MQVIFNYDRDYSTNLPSAIALGTFDGIHMGHRKLINELLLQKRKYKYQTIVYTFIEHPLHVLAHDKEPPRIMLLREKIKEFSRLGVDILLLNSFDNFLLHQAPHEFLEQLYKKIPIKSFVVGFNFRFGHKGAGNIIYLQKEAEQKELDLITVPPVKSEGEVVSSTLIRKKIQEGKMRDAAKLLTQPYSISGKVIQGFGRGKDLGFPTANLGFSSHKIMPAYGVYLTKCTINRNIYWGVTNIGINPTFSNNNVHVETHILDYNKNLYGQYMKISFIDRLRQEIKFDSAEELSRQMERDVIKAKKLIYKKR